MKRCGVPNPRMNSLTLPRALQVCFALFTACSQRTTVGVVDDDDAALGAASHAGVAEPVLVRPDASTLGCDPAPSIAVCDPVHNSGCSRALATQCAVDLTATTLSGVCVFRADTPASGLCLDLPGFESCPPGQRCIDGEACHTLCLCDADCPASACCKAPVGDLGFKTCVPC